MLSSPRITIPIAFSSLPGTYAATAAAFWRWSVPVAAPLRMHLRSCARKFGATCCSCSSFLLKAGCWRSGGEYIIWFEEQRCINMHQHILPDTLFSFMLLFSFMFTYVTFKFISDLWSLWQYMEQWLLAAGPGNLRSSRLSAGHGNR